MYENITYEQIMDRLLERVRTSDPNIDTREGSVIYTALAPTAMEIQNMYIDLDNTLNEAFADTATRTYLIKRAKERGTEPYPATYAIRKGVFNTEVPIGSRFSLEELNYSVIENIVGNEYKLQCETPGTEGNRDSGTLLPIQYIEGLTSAELTDVLTAAVDEEDTEEFRKRYFDGFKAQAFGGNIADYKEKAMQISGVGGVKVYPTWNGGGTVKLVVQAADYGVPSQSVVSLVKETFDPTDDEGEGVGLAPIGHVVTAVALSQTTVNIETKITYATGWDWAATKTYIENAIDEYFAELSEDWADNTQIVVRISMIENKLIGIAGIIDISDTKLNGGTSNLILPSDNIPVRGTVTDNG